MAAIEEHLGLRNPRFRCLSTSGDAELVVSLTNISEPPATSHDIALLREVAGPNFDALHSMYLTRNGLMLHVHGDSAGLEIPPVACLAQLNADWREWQSDGFDAELPDFELGGFAFGTVRHSGNYFVVFEGRVYYSDHDSPRDVPFSASLDEFLARSVADPAGFLRETGCYTRYSDGHTDRQYYPVEFLHD